LTDQNMVQRLENEWDSALKL